MHPLTTPPTSTVEPPPAGSTEVSTARSAGAEPARPSDPRIERALARAESIADILDRALRVPGTNIRFGLDAIAGLVPVVGDTATTIVGLYPVFEARRLGVRRRVIARMLLNLGIDWLVGLVPIVDIIFDVGYKANVRNLKLLAEALGREAQ